MLELELTQRSDGVSAFICRCGDDGRAEADALTAEVRDRLGAGPGDRDFLTVVVFSLNWDFDAYINGIFNDQWSAVSAKTYDEESPFTAYVQCDEVEDGIAAVWKIFADRNLTPSQGMVR